MRDGVQWGLFRESKLANPFLTDTTDRSRDHLRCNSCIISEGKIRVRGTPWKEASRHRVSFWSGPPAWAKGEAEWRQVDRPVCRWKMELLCYHWGGLYFERNVDRSELRRNAFHWMMFLPSSSQPYVLILCSLLLITNWLIINKKLYLCRFWIALLRRLFLSIS